MLRAPDNRFLVALDCSLRVSFERSAAGAVINKQLFFLQVPRAQTKLSTMLEKLGMKYEGRPHCGLDDSRNIARIAIRMLQDGCQLRVNERMHGGQLLSVPSSAPVEGAPPPHNPRSRD